MAGEIVRCGHCGTPNRVPAAAAGTPRCGKCHQPLAWIADADDATFAEIAEAAKIPVVVDLWAPWCGPCRMVSPALERLARDLAGKVKLVKVNVDTSPQISQRFGVQAIPTLLILRHGQVAARQTGAVPLATLRTWVDNALTVNLAPTSATLTPTRNGPWPCRPPGCWRTGHPFWSSSAWWTSVALLHRLCWSMAEADRARSRRTWILSAEVMGSSVNTTVLGL